MAGVFGKIGSKCGFCYLHFVLIKSSVVVSTQRKIDYGLRKAFN